MILRKLTSAFLLAAPLSAYGQAGAVNSLALWSRKPGNFTDIENPEKNNLKTLDLSHFKLQKRTMRDAQYERDVTYKGIPLSQILSSYKPSDQDDMAILHFDNGMAIPLMLEPGVLSRLDPFLALEICETKTECVTSFPSIGKDEVYGLSDDPRPLTFTWNKIVVSKEWHPAVPAGKSGIFSPWRHVDSLAGIEFVNAAAYYRQFEFGKGSGEKVFKARCQFCHGIRNVGARYGWDYATPLAIYEKRSPEHLLNHVKYPKVLAKKKGLMMPTQDDVTLSEMQALWQWMKTGAKRKSLPAYQP
ncbi:MAG: cytochrome c [Deltaproteobacteria bacterium]|nr:cytochrome c [Deltaproteobacteria bacterium]